MRQIRNAYLHELPSPRLPTLRQCAELLRSSRCWLSSELTSELVAAGLADDPPSPIGLLNLLRETQLEVHYATYNPKLGRPVQRRTDDTHADFLIMDRRFEQAARKLRTRARRLSRRYGLARLRDAMSSIQGRDEAELRRFIRRLLQISDDVWTASDGGETWYLFEDGAHAILNAANTVFAAIDSCKIEEFAEACQRYVDRRKHAHGVAPQRLISRYLTTSTVFDVRKGRVQYKGASEGELTKIDRDLVDYLRTRPDGSFGKDVREHLRKLDHKADNVTRILGKSPLWTRRNSGRTKSGYTYFLIGDTLSESRTAEGEHPRYELYRRKLANLGKTDSVSTARRRNEQRILRAWLFEDKEEEDCALCGQRYPVSALVTAHKKRREVCNEAERLDPHIVMPLCLFGCDFVYEHQFLRVRDGIVSRGQVEGRPSAIAEYVGRLVGRTLDGQWTAGHRWYFDDDRII